MISPKSISTDKILPHSQDYSFLRKKGIEKIQQYSGSTWTDFNDHDPGVTLLEQICYTITDLGYRTGFEIENLLQSGSNKPSDTFFTAQEILPSHPITLNDYRKLLIDYSYVVKNAWVYPVFDNSQGISGVYKVLLQLDDDKKEPENILKEVRSILSRHRNLGEDFQEIGVLQKEKIKLSVRITLHHNSLGESVLGKVIARLEDYLSPPVRLFSREELEEEGYGINDIFDGPLPQNGFIKAEDLKPLRNEIRISELVDIISGMEGVSAIHDFILKDKDGKLITGDVIQMGTNRIPELENYLDPDFKESIKFYRGNARYHIDFNTANQIYASHSSRYKTSYLKKKSGRDGQLQQVDGVPGLEKYYPIQAGLPKIYGVGEYGVPKHMGSPSHARQLKGYMMVFEQLLANYLSQLANINKLFSIEEEKTTYYSQPPFSVSKVETILLNRKKNAHAESIRPIFNTFTVKLLSLGLKPSRYHSFDKLFDLFVKETEEKKVQETGEKGVGFDMALEKLGERIFVLSKKQKKRILIAPHLKEFKLEAVREGFRGNLATLMKQLDPFPERRNRFLDHLLARFSETFPGAEVARTNQTTEASFPDRIKKEKIVGKIQLLKNYVSLSRNRSRGYDYLHFSDEHDNVAELKKKISILLSFMDANESKLTQHRKFTEFLDIAKIEEGKKENLKNAPTQQFKFRSITPNVFQELLSNGTKNHQYQIVHPVEEGVPYRIFYGDNPSPVLETSSLEEAKGALTKLIDFLKNINESCEGFHLIEHILLRPIASAKHKFDLLDERYTKFLTSYATFEIDEKDEETKRNKQKELIDELIKFGLSEDNYTLEETDFEGKKMFVWVISNKQGEKIAKSAHPFQDDETKLKGNLKIIKVLWDLKEADLLTPRFQITEKDMFNYDGNFYSYQCSLVLPSWPSRFQRAEFRRYLTNLTYQHAPAHLTLNFHWLGIPEMKKFEDLYEKWLLAKEVPDPEQPELDELSNQLAGLLTSFDNRSIR